MTNINRISEMSELVQLPAIVNAKGEVVFFDAKFRDWSQEQLKLVADTMQAYIGYVKVRATYSPLENRMCSRYDCWSPVGENFRECDKHEV